MNYKKIAIIGRSATGKSTLSELLSNVYNLPVYHVDDYIWPAKNSNVPEEVYLPILNNIINTDRWVMEGYINKSMINRIHSADIVIYLDYSSFISLYRYIKRWFTHRVENRNAIKNNPEEKFSFKLLFSEIFKAIFNPHKSEIEDLLQNNMTNNIVRISSPKELDKFINRKFKNLVQSENTMNSEILASDGDQSFIY